MISFVADNSAQGIFAQGQLYVLVSRVADPQHFVLIGVPPRDLAADVARAVYAKGLGVDEFYRRACSVTNGWQYTHTATNAFVDRIQQRKFKQDDKAVPLTFRDLGGCLDPQPEASVVIRRLLEWIDMCDRASLDENAQRPPCCTLDGQSVFPPEDDKWWLTSLSRRKAEAAELAEAAPAGDDDGPLSDGSDIGEQEEDDDIIDPVLPIEDDDPFNDEDGDSHAPDGSSQQVHSFIHDAKVP